MGCGGYRVDLAIVSSKFPAKKLGNNGFPKVKRQAPLVKEIKKEIKREESLLKNTHDNTLVDIVPDYEMCTSLEILEFLYYETPVGKVRRNKQFGREHIDILVKERHSKALVVVEVKKQGEDMDSAVSQGLSYVEWLLKYKEQLKPRIAQLGWDVDIDRLKLIVLAPGTQIKNSKLDAAVLEQE